MSCESLLPEGLYLSGIRLIMWQLWCGCPGVTPGQRCLCGQEAFEGQLPPALPGAALLCFPGDSQRFELPHLTEPSEQSCPKHPLVIRLCSLLPLDMSLKHRPMLGGQEGSCSPGFKAGILASIQVADEDQPGVVTGELEVISLT